MIIIALNSYCFTPQYLESVKYDDDEDYYSAEDDSDSDDDEYVLTQEELLTASSTSSASVVGSRSAISTSIRGLRWRTVPLALTASSKAVSSPSLLFVEHFSSTSKSLERVSLISWTVAPSSSGLTRFLSSRRIEA